jgi:hypothetical protein
MARVAKDEGEIVRGAIDAFNRGDFEDVIALLEDSEALEAAGFSD